MKIFPWCRKASLAVLTVAAMLVGVGAAPSTSASTSGNAAAVTVPAAAGDPTLKGRVVVDYQVAIDLGRYAGKPEDAWVEWYLDGVEQDERILVNGVSYEFAIPGSAAGKTLTAHVWVHTREENPLEFILSGGKVAAATFDHPPTPVISGTPMVGERLTVKPGFWPPYDVKLRYQWLLDGSEVHAGTKSSYTVTPADAGKHISVRVTGTRTGYITASKASAVHKIVPGHMKLSRTMKVTGAPKYGATLKVSAGWPSGSKVDYQWYRGASKVRGAVKTSYKLTSADIGKAISVKAKVTMPGYNTHHGSAKTAKVGKATLSVKSKPKISGTKKAGSGSKSVRAATRPSPLPIPTAGTAVRLRSRAHIVRATG